MNNQGCLSKLLTFTGAQKQITIYNPCVDSNGGESVWPEKNLHFYLSPSPMADAHLAPSLARNPFSRSPLRHPIPPSSSSSSSSLAAALPSASFRSLVSMAAPHGASSSPFTNCQNPSSFPPPSLLVFSGMAFSTRDSLKCKIYWFMCARVWFKFLVLFEILLFGTRWGFFGKECVWWGFLFRLWLYFVLIFENLFGSFVGTAFNVVFSLMNFPVKIKICSLIEQYIVAIGEICSEWNVFDGFLL